MTIIVTNSAGFIGSNFVINWLSSKNEKILGIDKHTFARNLGRFTSVEVNSNYKFVKKDTEDLNLTAEFIKKNQPRVINI